MRSRLLGAILVLTVGLLNFHLPHFLMESPRPSDPASLSLELVLLTTVIGAVITAGAITTGHRWGWWIGLLIVGLYAVLYLAQETVGLPGLPQNWFEPSRIVALIIEAIFVLLARHHIMPSRKLASATSVRGQG